MGTHPIFESDFDCLTEWVLRARAGERLLTSFKKVLQKAI